MFIKELKNFSRENWWVYLLFILLIIFVIFMDLWSPLEITLVFLANFIANIWIMVMQSNYTAKNNKLWSIYHIWATLIFLFISLYWFIVHDQSQYIIWQIAYSLAAIKAFSFYNFKKDLNFINEKSFVILNLVLFSFFSYKLELLNIENITNNLPFITQALWFSLITTGLVSIKDKLRYWFNVVWIFLLSSWSLWLTINSVLWIYPSESASLDAIAIWYFILTLTVFVYYIKLLPKYLK